MAVDLSYLPGVSNSRPKPAGPSYLPGVATSKPGQGGTGFGAQAAERFAKPTQTLGNITSTPAPAPSQQPSAPRPLNWRDAAYNAQIASIQRALQDFETGATTRGERYGQDFMTGLRGLGYRPAEGFQAMPNVLEQLDQTKAQPMAMSALSAEADSAPVSMTPVSGGFDLEGEYDPYSAAARGTRGTRDEFAARGTLRSSDFAKTFGEFQNRLQKQLDAMETSRTRFGQDLATEVAQQRTQSQEREQQAQRDAMMRAAVSAAGGAGF